MTSIVFRAAVIAAALALVPSWPESPAAAAQGKAQAPVMAMGPGGPVRAISTIMDHAYRHGVQIEAPLRLSASSDADAPDAVLRDIFIRYAKAVGFGQITPQTAGMTWEIAQPHFNASAAQNAFETGSLGTALSTLPPPHRAYGALVEALARYREIAARGGWPQIPDGKLLSRGMNDPRVPALRRRLAAEGVERVTDLQATTFDQSLEVAVIEFQRRQGLEPDGVIGPKTRAALNVPVGQRVWQIMVNMERWRWLPRHLPTRRLEVNIAAARLDVIDGTRRVLRMRTVVGSPRHPTPVLASEIRAVVINPSWNVPTSIWKREIFPSLRRNQNYLAARHMEIIGRPQDPQGRRIDWRSHRTPPPGIQIRQIPGPFNALGRVKFHIPNRFDVYLHDTPQRSFFKRADRALSHGCIRLEQPDRLLAFLFPDEAMRPQLAGPDTPQPRTTQTVAVAEPLPVFLLYWTAFAGADGTMHFRDDIYGHDSEMIAALSRPGRDMQQASLATGCREKQNQT